MYSPPSPKKWKFDSGSEWHWVMYPQLILPNSSGFKPHGWLPHWQLSHKPYGFLVKSLNKIHTWTQLYFTCCFAFKVAPAIHAYSITKNLRYEVPSLLSTVYTTLTCKSCKSRAMWDFNQLMDSWKIQGFALNGSRSAYWVLSDIDSK